MRPPRGRCRTCGTTFEHLTMPTDTGPISVIGCPICVPQEMAFFNELARVVRGLTPGQLEEIKRKAHA